MAADEVASYSGLWAPYSTKSTDKTNGDGAEVTRNPNSAMDKNAFLNLLVTQMKYQDPLNPTDDKQFLAQMAQFTSLEQMQNMNATNSKSQAYTMIGKEIYAETYNSQTYTLEAVEGQVAAVTMKNGNPYLIVMDEEGNSKNVALEDVVEVYDTSASAASSQMQGIYSSLSVSQHMALVGKHIQAISSDSEGNPIFVEGKVDYVKFYNNQALLVVGDKEVYGPEVMSVSEGMLLLENQISATKKNEATGEYDSYIDGGTITGVKMTDKDVYLIVDGKEVKIDTISYVTEAISYFKKGLELTSGDVKGAITGVVIQDGKTYLQVGEGEEAQLVEFTKVRGKL